MTKKQLLKKFQTILSDRSFILNDYNKTLLTVKYIPQNRTIKALTKDAILLDNGLFIGYFNLSLKLLISIYDILLQNYINSLTYGNVLKYKFKRLSNIGGIIYTSTLNEVSLLKCTLVKYWQDDKYLTNAFKVKLVPFNKNYETITMYVSDFKTIIKQFI